MFAGWLRDHLTAAGLHELSGEEIVAHLGPEQVDQFLALYEQELWEQRHRKFANLFPDEFRKIGEGEWSEYWPRSGYPRHLEFFRAGKKWDERCFMAGNRVGKCRLYNDLIQHPDGSESRIGDLFMRAEPFDVLAWDGRKMVAAPASHVVRKPPEITVELFLSSGARFTCSLDHVLLTDAGWQHVRHLLRSVPCRPPSSAAPDPLTRAADAPRWWRTAQGWWARCSGDRHPCDAPPLDAVTVVRSLAPSPADARQRSLVGSPWGDRAHRRGGSPSRCAPLLSSLDDVLPSVALSAGCEGQGACMCVRRRTGSHRGHLRPLAASASHLRSCDEGGQGLSGRRALVSPGMAGNHVVGYRFAGVHALYDLTVPGFHNYVADDVVHHNTVVGGYETTCHLTGLYPDWWEGRRFRHPIRAIAAGKTNETTRDIVQATLLGDITWQGNRKTVDGTGIIPTELIGRGNGQLVWKQGSPDLVDNVKIRHVSGGWSKLNLKSYQQGRGAFEGTAQHLIWTDEEPEADVYDEARIRTMTTGGITMLTYTPLEGLTETVLSFLPQEMRPASDEPLATGDWGNWNA